MCMPTPYHRISQFLCQNGHHYLPFFQSRPYRIITRIGFARTISEQKTLRHFSDISSAKGKMPQTNGVETVTVKGYQAVQKSGRKNGIAPDLVVDLRTDVLTQPSKEMREAIANAAVGDDVFLEDPTSIEFEKRVATILGKEAALFVTSGTLGNLICNLVHCNTRGSELICGSGSHIFNYEQGNISQFGGIHSCQIQNEPDGTFSLQKLKELIRMDDVHYPITKLVCIENTHNRCGGRVLPQKWIDELAEICKQNKIPIHMDGARLFNAVIATGLPASRIVRDMASVNICFSKGLGAPVGSCIAGSRAFIEQARRMRKALGSGMRQNGILTAAGIYCLDNMIERLKEDHDNAKRIVEIVNSKGGKFVWSEEKHVETNILILYINAGCSAPEFVDRLDLIEDEAEERAALGGKTVAVKCFPLSASTARLVCYFGITREMAEKGALKICYLAKKIAKEAAKEVAV